MDRLGELDLASQDVLIALSARWSSSSGWSGRSSREKMDADGAEMPGAAGG
jgi:hypothetical protein